MRKKSILILITLCFIIIFANSCKEKKHNEISINEVLTVDIFYNGIKKTTYQNGKDLNEIKKLINAFNEARDYNNDLGTTDPIVIIIILKNNEIVKIFGGAQGFQAVQRGNSQYNIKGDKLKEYFDELKQNYNK